MTKLVDNKIAIVTGAGAGIGKAVAQTLAREGASVMLAGRNSASLEAVASAIQEAGGVADICVTDVSKSDQAEHLVARTVQRFGRLDCAVNNAGVDGALAPIGDYDDAEFERVIDINLKGVWFCTRHQIKAMLESGGGSIVNMSSALSEVAQYNMPAYVASKFAVNGLSKSAALDYAPHNIRVNALSPGLVETDMMKQQFDANDGMRDMFIGLEPVGRMGEPEEIAEAALWLCSDRSSYATGSNMVVDGGYLIK